MLLIFGSDQLPQGGRVFNATKVPPRRRPSAANTGNIRHRKGGQPTLDAAPSLMTASGAARAVPAAKAERPLSAQSRDLPGTQGNGRDAPITAIRSVRSGAPLDPRRMGAAVV